MFRRAFLVVAAVAALAAMAMPAMAAKGGNSANAKKCQKGGWETKARTGSTVFTSEDACTSYAAEGGTLVDLTLASPSVLCVSIAGSFEDFGQAGFECFNAQFVSNSTTWDAVDDGFAAACTTLGGGRLYNSSNDGVTGAYAFCD